MGAIRCRLGLTAPARHSGGSRPRWRPGLVGFLLLSVLGWSLVASPAPAAAAIFPNVTVQLAPSSIVANGTSTTIATATVTGLLGPVSGDTVIFTGPGPTPIVAVAGSTPGTYTATLTSSTAAGLITVTATDTTQSISGTATLTQTPGPATNVSVLLTPASIVANGSSTTTATAKVTDGNGNLVPGDNVVIVSSDPGDAVSPKLAAHDNGDGTYTATVTSSTTPGAVQVVAVDQTTGAHGQTTLTQTSNASTTSLSVVPAQPVTNQTETMIATVNATQSVPAGTVAFENGGVAIATCAGVPLVPAGTFAATAACQASFAAANTPVALTAVFTPTGAASVGGSSSPVDSMTVSQDSTSTNLTASSANPIKGSSVTYLVSVTPNHAGPTQPGGFVQFADGKNALTGCAKQPLLHGSSPSGTAAAVCRVSFGSTGTHVITAHYLGDASFTRSDSPSAQTVVHKRPPPKRLSAMLVWIFSFPFGGTTTTVTTLIADGFPPGASIHVTCHGHGCPYRKRTIVVSNSQPCKTTFTLRCTKLRSTTVDLAPAFAHHRLRVGTQLTVELLRPGWIGKYVQFTMRAGRGPGELIACLAPGGQRPGVGCRKA